MKNLLYVIQSRRILGHNVQLYRQVYYQLQYMKPRMYSHTSRYCNLRRIQDEDTNNVYHENWVKKGVDVSKDDFYVTVTTADEGRLDIIANRYLHTAKYWWVIALANDIIDPFDVPIGTRLRIPQFVSLYNNGGVLSGN